MSSKIVALSVSLLLDAESLDDLDAATEAARSAFAAAGNSELLLEEVTQLPAFLSMLPGAGRYQLRRKGCTSRNAADFLPVYAPWRGTARAASVLLTPTGDAFRFDLFDKSSGVNAHHGIVVADTGSGKSVTLGALTLDARAAGVEAILIDNGKSWKPLTELLGGIHIPVDLSTSISPFLSYAQLAGSGTEISNEEIEHVVQFIEVCVADRTRPPFDKVERDVVSRAIRWCYETRFRPHPEEPPLIGHFSSVRAPLRPSARRQHHGHALEEVPLPAAVPLGGIRELQGAELQRVRELRGVLRRRVVDANQLSRDATSGSRYSAADSTVSNTPSR